MIAGFEMPTSGQIIFDGEDITNLPPHLRRVNTVFQKYALFPHLNVFNNIAFGLKMKLIPNGTKRNRKGEEVQLYRKYTKAEIKAKVDDALSMVDLEDYGHRGVASLSGGQQQRVAIARAIVNEPEVLLLDEPLGALDLKMRKDMQLELMDMHKRLGITFVYVTHDQEEALTMSDKIVVMRDGVIQQIATPETVYDEPANAFVADFIGESNILSGAMLADYKVEFADTVFECVDKGFKRNEPIDVIIRPEDLKIREKDDPKTILTATGPLVGVQGRPLPGDADGGRERAHRARHRDVRSGLHGGAVHQAVRPAHHAQGARHQRDRHRDGGRERGVDLGRQVRMQLPV